MPGMHIGNPPPCENTPDPECSLASLCIHLNPKAMTFPEIQAHEQPFLSQLPFILPNVVQVNEAHASVTIVAPDWTSRDTGHFDAIEMIRSFSSSVSGPEI